VEQGSHAELLALRGRYFGLYTMAYNRDNEDAEAAIQL
jgi:hypothetical protein